MTRPPYRIGEDVAAVYLNHAIGGTCLAPGYVTSVEPHHGTRWHVRVVVAGRPDPIDYYVRADGYSDVLGRAADFPLLFPTPTPATRYAGTVTASHGEVLELADCACRRCPQLPNWDTPSHYSAVVRADLSGHVTYLQHINPASLRTVTPTHN